jgi:hypothetical protein
MKSTHPYQDNTTKGVKKLDKGETTVSYIFHKEGQKPYCKENKPRTILLKVLVFDGQHNHLD